MRVDTAATQQAIAPTVPADTHVVALEGTSMFYVK
jgi:hypothetical protein